MYNGKVTPMRFLSLQLFALSLMRCWCLFGFCFSLVFVIRTNKSLLLFLNTTRWGPTQKCKHISAVIYMFFVCLPLGSLILRIVYESQQCVRMTLEIGEPSGKQKQLATLSSRCFGCQGICRYLLLQQQSQTTRSKCCQRFSFRGRSQNTTKPY